MTATAAQIDYIRSLQADKAWKGEIDFTVDGARAAVEGSVFTIFRYTAESDLPAYYADLIAARRLMEAATTPEELAAGRAALRAGTEVAEAGAAADYLIEMTEAQAALAIDPTTLDKAEASRIIDLLKAL